MMVLGKRITLSKDKVKVITEWKPPTYVKGICSFLDLAYFYQQFIADFAAVSKPLTSLTKKDVLFTWGVEQQLVFDTLKTKFTTALILSFSDPAFPMQLETDVSAFTIGAALIIQQSNSWKPAAYISHSLLGAKLNWLVYEKELFTIVKAFKAWHHWLLLAHHEIEVWLITKT